MFLIVKLPLYKALLNNVHNGHIFSHAAGEAGSS